MKSLHWFVISFVLAALALWLAMSGGGQQASVVPSSSSSVAVAVSTSSPHGAAVSSAHPAVALVRVVDGDTLIVRIVDREERVRIVGIDAPEVSGKECFAAQATDRLKALVTAGSITLAAKPDEDRDGFGRLLRYVFVQGQDVGLRLVAEGYVLSYEKYPHPELGAYEAAETWAQTERQGLWGACEPLARSSSSATGVSSGCTIKGNINQDGRRFYHVPGCRSYAVTQIDAAKMERWFCTEEEAQAAGWVKAGGCP